MVRSNALPADSEQSITAAAKAESHRLSRRRLLLLSATLLTGAALSSCTSGTQRLLPPLTDSALTDSRVTDSGANRLPTPDREEIQLVYQDWRTDWFPNVVEELLTEFHDEHPQIRVFFTPDPENLADAMLVDMQAGTAPDLFWGGSTFFPIWAQQGHMRDLRDYVAANLDADTLADWDPAQYRAFFLSNGEQFGLPKYCDAPALYYNKAMFDEAGVAYPHAQWSHEEYWLAMQQLTVDTSDGVRERWGSMVDISWDHMQTYVNRWGGHLVGEHLVGGVNISHCVADEPDATAALEWLRARIWEDHLMAGFSDVQYMSPRSAFINQRVAMIEEGSLMLKEILRNSDFPIGIAPLPRGPVQRAVVATADGYGIFRETQYADAAWELLQFLTSPRVGRALAEVDLLQPARTSLIDDWMAFVHTEFPEKTDDIALSAFVDGHVNGYSVTMEIAENMAEVAPRLMAAFEQMFILGQAPVSMMYTVCAQINGAQRDVRRPRFHLLE